MNISDYIEKSEQDLRTYPIEDLLVLAKFYNIDSTDVNEMPRILSNIIVTQYTEFFYTNDDEDDEDDENDDDEDEDDDDEDDDDEDDDDENDENDEEEEDDEDDENDENDEEVEDDEEEDEDDETSGESHASDETSSEYEEDIFIVGPSRQSITHISKRSRSNGKQLLKLRN